jgi:hypothetical protein
VSLIYIVRVDTACTSIIDDGKVFLLKKAISSFAIIDHTILF